MSETTFFAAAFILFGLSAGAYLIYLFSGRERTARAGLVLAAAAVAAHSVALVARAIESGHAPFTNMYESLSFLAWSIAVAFVLTQIRFRIPRAGLALMVIILAVMALASSPLMPKEAAPLVPALQSYWLWLHVSLTLFGEAFFAVAFVTSLMYLRTGDEDRRARLDAISYRSVAVGFPIFTLGGLVFGMVWAQRAWGSYWSWDPKEVWSLITWIVFALYLHTRIVKGWKGKRSAVIAIIGFLAALFTYFGVNYLLSGLHSYA
jgi:ABC-type transport system involved in cytochrome c biogenesis permease subunit